MTYLILLLAHYLLDFPLQGDYLARTKASEPYSMIAHVMIYSLGIATVYYLLGIVSETTCIIIFFGTAIQHFIVDRWKASQKEPKKWHIWVDQVLHIAMLMAFAVSL
jgi:hypothetical protein